jgi:hypothetical protein
MLKLGTKSLIFGAHCFFVHPVFVYLGWYKLYGRPNWKESICILIHDWGYWGSDNIDGQQGQKHPELGARIANFLFGDKYNQLCLYHSRAYAKSKNHTASKLCWADKMGLALEPWWTFVPRSCLTGEIKEYRGYSDDDKSVSNKDWWNGLRNHFNTISVENSKN